MRYLVINTKNYLEASGKKLDALAQGAIEAIKKTRSCKIFLAPSSFDLRYLHTRYPRLSLLTQHLDYSRVGSSTGDLVPEMAEMSGARGSIINHSEHRLTTEKVAKLVEKLRDLGMTSVVCARDEKEVALLASMGPDFIAIEPPELIGSGNAVSKASPEVILRSKSALSASKPPAARTRLLCGAGIVNASDAEKAVELGSEGILIASGVVLANSPKKKISELVSALSGAKQRRVSQ